MSDTPASLMKRAEDFHFAKQFAKAVQIYRQIIHDFPDSKEAKVASQQIDNLSSTSKPGGAVRCLVCSTGWGKREFGVCSECAYNLGLLPRPPARRPPVPCSRCQGRRFVRVVPRQYVAHGEFGSALNNYRHVIQIHQHGTPMTLTAEAEGGNDLRTLGSGVVETYVCTGCGFIEWYCQDPQSIPIGDQYNTEVVDYGSDSPYR